MFKLVIPHCVLRTWSHFLSSLCGQAKQSTLNDPSCGLSHRLSLVSPFLTSQAFHKTFYCLPQGLSLVSPLLTSQTFLDLSIAYLTGFPQASPLLTSYRCLQFHSLWAFYLSNGLHAVYISWFIVFQGFIKGITDITFLGNDIFMLNFKNENF